MVAPHRSQAHSRLSLLHWAHRRLLHPQFAMVVLLRLAACSTPTSQFSMVASLRSQSSLEMLPASLGSSTAIAATGCAVSFALIGVFVPACASLARYSGAADALWACPRPSTPSGLRRLRPVSRTARGLRAPPPYTPPGTIIPRKGFRFAQFPCRAAISPSPRVGGKAAFDTDQMPDLYEENEKNHSHATFHRKVHLGYRRD